ncbi:MAG: nucleotidyl transferase AbiEii/AbiGii toxin family protein [Bacteroidota bacterium]
MLQTQTIEPGTLSLLKSLMNVPSLRQSFLVGGTALSLKYGHRISIDLDLFYTDELDKAKIFEELHEIFRENFDYRGNPNSFGIFCHIYNIKVDIIKYPHKMIHEPEIFDDIRIYHSDDIVAMKINAILGRGKKKDFWDIAELTQHYSIGKMIELHQNKYPSQQLLISTPTALTYFDDANDSEDPVSLKGQTWESVKQTISKAVREYLS